MANRTNKLNTEQVLKIEQQVQQFAQHVQKYKKLFLADDGRIDSDEQQQLNALQVRMDQINQRLTELKGGVETNLSPTENVDDSIDATDTFTVNAVKRKDSCAKMLQNWQNKIISPFREKAAEIINSTPDNLEAQLNALAEKLYDKYHRRRWFDPQNNNKGTQAFHFISVYHTLRTFVLRRDVSVGSEGAIEVPSTYNGSLDGNKSGKTIQVGMNDVVEIEVPKDTATKMIIGGQLSYTLDSLNIPDTFVLLDINSPIYNKLINGGKQSDRIPFNELTGNLSIDVQESTNTSIWEATIKLEFIQVQFNIPACNPNEIPCYNF